MSKEPADLQIELRRDGADVQATLTFTPPRSDAAVDLGTGPVRRDPVRLRALEADSHAYGTALAEQFFADAAVRNGWSKARSAARAMGCPLRVRLLIRDTAAELHEDRWERMLDPESGDFVSIGVD